MHGLGAVARGSDVHMWGAGFRSCRIFGPKVLSAYIRVRRGIIPAWPSEKFATGIGRPKSKNKIKVHVFPMPFWGACRHAQRRADRRARNGGQPQPEPDLGGAVAHGFRSAVHYKRQVSKNLYEALDNVSWYQGKFNEVGLEPIMYCSEYGYRDFFSVKKPIRSVADPAGIQVRTTASTVVGSKWRKPLGMKPKPLAWGETYTALKEGIVEVKATRFLSCSTRSMRISSVRLRFTTQLQYADPERQQEMVGRT